MEEERLWKFRKPEWLNSMWARNAGVYGAGALVSFCLHVFNSYHTEMPSRTFFDDENASICRNPLSLFQGTA